MTKVMNLRAMVILLFVGLLLLVLVNSISSAFSGDSISIPWSPVPASKESGFVNSGIETPQPVEVGGFSLEDGVKYEAGFELMENSFPMESLEPPRTVIPQVLFHDWEGLRETTEQMKGLVDEGGSQGFAAQSVYHALLQLDYDLYAFLAENEGTYEQLRPYEQRFVLLREIAEVVLVADMDNSVRVLAPSSMRGTDENLFLLDLVISGATKAEVNYYQYLNALLILRFNVVLAADDTLHKPDLSQMIKVHLPYWHEQGIAGQDVFNVLRGQEWRCNPIEASEALKSLGYDLD